MLILSILNKILAMRLVQMAILLVLSTCTNFTIEGSTHCVDYFTGSSNCKEWIQVGTIYQQTYGCFSQDTIVQTKVGFKKMKQLQVGDYILGMKDGKQNYGKVIAWLHKDPLIEVNFLQLTLNSFVVNVTHNHNIAAKNGSYLFAKHFKNSSLYGIDEELSFKQDLAKGMYAPFTQNHNYFVYFQQHSQAKMLAHDFAEIQNPTLYEKIIDYGFKIWQILRTQNKSETHPFFTGLGFIFKFMIR